MQKRSFVKVAFFQFLCQFIFVPSAPHVVDPNWNEQLPIGFFLALASKPSFQHISFLDLKKLSVGSFGFRLLWVLTTWRVENIAYSCTPFWAYHTIHNQLKNLNANDYTVNLRFRSLRLLSRWFFSPRVTRPFLSLHGLRSTVRTFTGICLLLQQAEQLVLTKFPSLKELQERRWRILGKHKALGIVFTLQQLTQIMFIISGNYNWFLFA